jgi:hypothetical protein
VSSPATRDYFKLCSECKKPIGFAAGYYRCSVSTCNRKQTALYFCSVPCWDAHVPVMRHRDAWAETAQAPTREVFVAELEQEREAAVTAEEKTRRIVDVQPSTKEALVVVSKLKQYVKAASGMNTSDAVMDLLSGELRRICDRAIVNAEAAGRKTVLDRDIAAALRRGD